MKLRLLTLLAAVALTSLAGHAQSDTLTLRPASVAVTLDVGHVRSLDTYISPLRYEGTHFRLGFDRLRATRFNPQKWVWQIAAGLTYDHPSNPARNNSLQTVIADADFAMMHRWRFAHGLSVYAGGDLGFDGGVTYNPRNSNNVCSPIVHLAAGGTGMISWSSHLRKRPLVVRWQTTIPVVGGFFLPDYDQSFYEMYLGNYSNTINFASWANRFDMHNAITADIHFGAAALRLGYRNEFTTLWENNISQRRCVHSLVVGVAWESLLIDPRRGLPEKARMISATY